MGTTPGALPATRPARWWSLERVAAFSGILFAVFLIVAMALHGAFTGALPDNTAPPENIAEYYIDRDVEILVAHVFDNFANFFLFIFSGILWKTLRRVEADPAWLSATVFAAGVSSAVVATIGNVFWGTAGNIARDYTMTTEDAILLFHFGVIFFIAWLPTSVMQFGTAVLIFRTGVFPRWVAWLAVADIALWAISQWPIPRDASTFENVVFDYSGPLAFVAALVWIIALSVILTWRAAKPAVAPEAGPGAA